MLSIQLGVQFLVITEIICVEKGARSVRMYIYTPPFFLAIHNALYLSGLPREKGLPFFLANRE